MRTNQLKIIFFWILFGVISRLIPHPANVTPITNLCLLSGAKLSRLNALIVIVISLVLSDTMLAYLYHLPVFGSWSLFTYSAFIVIGLIGKKLSHTPSTKKLLIFVLSSSLGFWIWTNFGVWLSGELYPRTLQGLIICYTAALPYLRNAVLGDLIWMVVIFGGYDLVEKNIRHATKIPSPFKGEG